MGRQPKGMVQVAPDGGFGLTTRWQPKVPAVREFYHRLHTGDFGREPPQRDGPHELRRVPRHCASANMPTRNEPPSGTWRKCQLDHLRDSPGLVRRLVDPSISTAFLNRRSEVRILSGTPLSDRDLAGWQDEAGIRLSKTGSLVRVKLWHPPDHGHASGSRRQICRLPSHPASPVREKAIEPTFSRGHRDEVSGKLAPRRTTGTITL
jgi:hypothetical protein